MRRIRNKNTNKNINITGRKRSCFFRQGTAVLLAAVLMLGGSVSAAAAGSTGKDENVYVNLKQDGSVDGIYVVNAYHLQEDGQIVDYGKYDTVKNLTTDEKITVKGDEVKVDAPKGKFFYQGNLKTKEIPWDILIRYELDGKETKAEELAGRSGALKIKIHVGRNKKVDEVFFENYLLQATVTMDMDRCSSLQAAGATVANVGSNKQLLYNIMAGSEKDILITADVLDFEMDAISFQAVPMSFDIDRDVFEMDSLYEKTDEIKDAADEFSDGAIELEDGADALREGADSLKEGADSLKEGVASYADGTKTVGDGIDTLKDGSDELADGAADLADGISSLRDGVRAMRDGYQGENGLATGARKLSEGANKLAAGSAQMKDGVGALISMIRQMGNGGVTAQIDQKAKEGLEAAAEQITNPVMKRLFEEMLANTSDGEYAELIRTLDGILDGMIGRLEKELGDAVGNIGTGNSIQDSLDKNVTNKKVPGKIELETESSETEEETSTEYPTEEETPSESEPGETESKPVESESEETESKPTESEPGETESRPSESESGETVSKPSESESGEIGSKPLESEPGEIESKTSESESGETENKPAESEPKEAESKPSENESGKTVNKLDNNTSASGNEIARISVISKETGTMAIQRPSFEQLRHGGGFRPGQPYVVTLTSDNRDYEVMQVAEGDDSQSGSTHTGNLQKADLDKIQEEIQQKVQELSMYYQMKAQLAQLLGAYEVAEQIEGQLGDETNQKQLAQLEEGIAALDGGVKELAGGMKELSDGIDKLADGADQLAGGADELASGGFEFADGTKELADGVTELADGAQVLMDAAEDLKDGSAQLADGTGEFADGTKELFDGVKELKDGTDEFKEKTGDIDTQVDEEIDRVINDFSGSGFTQVSFVSDKNRNVDLVQFVMKTEGIHIPKDQEIVAPKEPKSFWQRLLELFRR